MSAEILRRAASLMRERAEAATLGRWAAHVREHHDYDYPATDYSVVTEYDDGKSGYVGELLDLHDAEHIASWHPAVALAVADWLDAEASNRDAGIGGRGWFSVGGQTDALTVARAYLGKTA